jgi:isoquinoline 1-oxidoreductase beta subunit
MSLVTRRGLLLTGAALGGTALVAAVAGVGYLATVDVDGLNGRVDGENAVLNAFVTINPDGTVVIFVPRTEMGQGIHTGLAMVVAEELDLPLDDRIRVEFPSEAHPAYSNWFNALQQRPEEAGGPVVWLARRIFGQMGFVATGASGSTMGLWHPMRLAGAAARHMLVAAAAQKWGVAATELTTGNGFVHHEATRQNLSYGELARVAALLPPPDEPRLKPRSEWKLIGTSQPRVDLPEKLRGAPVFGIDVALPNMLYAAIRQTPVFGAPLVAIRNEAEVRAAPGVVDLAVIDGKHVAVVARSWWQAEQAAWLLQVQWAETEAEAVDSAGMARRLKAGLATDAPYEHSNIGDGAAAMDVTTSRLVEAEYSVPFVTHACMEPINATALLRPDGAGEVWVSTQNVLTTRLGVARGMEWAGVSPTEVAVHVTMNGGAFGRRSDLDVVAQASYLAARHPGRPVKLIWSREEDIGRGLYRSHAAARLRARLGSDGLPQAFDGLVAAQSAMADIAARNTPLPVGPDGDLLTVEGLDKPYYAIPNRRTRSQHVPSHLPIHFWRSNGFSFNTFFTESFIDECAFAAGIDPLDYRRRLLRDNPRHLAVLNRVAKMAGWGKPMAAGRGLGLAIEECYRSVVAQVAEVTVSSDGALRVDRIFCAIDAGLVINPQQVIAQMEGGALFGTTTALMSTISVRGGAVVESNFHDFPMQRLANAPDVLVEIVDSDLPPCGVGEPGVVPTAAAIANAIHAATGRRLRSLPLAVTESIGERQTRSVLTTS